jgi:hypothetical protein
VGISLTYCASPEIESGIKPLHLKDLLFDSMVVLSQKSVMGDIRIFLKRDLSVLQGGGGSQKMYLHSHS